MLRSALLIPLLAPFSAFAQDEDDGPSTRGKDEVVREVVRGLYLKADVGSTLWFGTHGYARPTGGPLLSGVVSSSIGVGQEFIDRERFSVAWEVDFYQGLFNGPRTEELSLIGPFIQGDVHILGGIAQVEASTYVTRRLGLGVAGGGGVLAMPLLLEPTAYQENIVPLMGGEAVLNSGPLPTVVVTPTLEYYTKLSHFSVGFDLPVMYAIGFDLGLAPMGYLKYTF
jgi:hypothetical protein